MPAASSRSSAAGLRFGGAWMLTSGRQDQAGDRDRPEMVRKRRLGRVRHRGAGLGAEVLDDDLLEMAVLGVQRAQRQQRLDPLAPGLADADQDAARERHARARRRLRIVASRTAGRLSGQPWCGPPRSHSRSAADSSISPAETETARSRSRSRSAHHARIDVRQQAGRVAGPAPRPRPDSRSWSRARAPPAPRAPRGSAAPAGRRA